MFTIRTSFVQLRLVASNLPLSRVPISCHRRSMSSSMLRLDPAIFNHALYKQVIHVWFSGLDLRGETLDNDIVRRWFQPTPEERQQFDTVCQEAFAPALAAIGPEQWPNPTAEPFIVALKNNQQETSKDQSEEAAWAALSLTLLLDQIPRNVFRTGQGLRRVYTHYDLISYSLNHALLSSSIISRPDLHPIFVRSAAHRLWFYMPLMHSEDLQAHDLLDKILADYGQELVRQKAGEGSTMFLDAQLKAEKSHREILEKFGRYPHRNQALARSSTAEETKFLKDGGATFGVGHQSDG